MIRRTQWDPFEDLLGAQDELNQMSPALAHALGLHGQRQGATIGGTPAWMPPLDISERKDAYLITVELPGVELDDVQITMEGSLLTIQGERHFAHDSSEQQFHRIERRYGSFRRSITLPAHVMTDAVQATAGGGVLQILVPKAEEAKPKQIQVRPTDNLEAATTPPPGRRTTATPLDQVHLEDLARQGAMHAGLLRVRRWRGTRAGGLNACGASR